MGKIILIFAKFFASISSRQLSFGGINMQDMNVLVILSIIIGIMFIGISFFLKDKKDKEVDLNNNQEPITSISSPNTIDEAEMMKEVNQKILELNDYASFIKKEINDQHKELLFLYQLITEKEKNLKQATNTGSVEDEQLVTLQSQSVTRESNKPLATLNNMIVENNKEIFDLYKQGLSVTEIAQSLNVGKGEVKLILDLGIR